MSFARDIVDRVGGCESLRREGVSVGYYKSRLGICVIRGVLLRGFRVVRVRVWGRGFGSCWRLRRGLSGGSRVEFQVTEGLQGEWHFLRDCSRIAQSASWCNLLEFRGQVISLFC